MNDVRVIAGGRKIRWRRCVAAALLSVCPRAAVATVAITSQYGVNEEFTCKKRYLRFSEFSKNCDFYYQLHGISVKPMFSCFDKERTT